MKEDMIGIASDRDLRLLHQMHSFTFGEIQMKPVSGQQIDISAENGCHLGYAVYYRSRSDPDMNGEAAIRFAIMSYNYMPSVLARLEASEKKIAMLEKKE